MTREEFMATTDIKSPEEAKEYLKKLRRFNIVLPFLLISGIALAVIFNKYEKFFYINFIFILPLLVGMHKKNSLQLEISNKVNKREVKFKSRLGALLPRVGEFEEMLDFSKLVKSLEIIAGLKPTPEKIETFNSSYEMPSVANTKGDKVFWKNAGLAFIISLIIFAIAIYFS